MISDCEKWIRKSTVSLFVQRRLLVQIVKGRDGEEVAQRVHGGGGDQTSRSDIHDRDKNAEEGGVEEHEHYGTRRQECVQH